MGTLAIFFFFQTYLNFEGPAPTIGFDTINAIIMLTCNSFTQIYISVKYNIHHSKKWNFNKKKKNVYAQHSAVFLFKQLF